MPAGDRFRGTGGRTPWSPFPEWIFRLESNASWETSTREAWKNALLVI